MTCRCIDVKGQPSSEDLVADVLVRWAGAAAVLQRYGMACSGRVTDSIMTLGQAAASFNIEPNCLTAEIALATAFPNRP